MTTGGIISGGKDAKNPENEGKVMKGKFDEEIRKTFYELLTIFLILSILS